MMWEACQQGLGRICWIMLESHVYTWGLEVDRPKAVQASEYGCEAGFAPACFFASVHYWDASDERQRTFLEPLITDRDVGFLCYPSDEEWPPFQALARGYSDNDKARQYARQGCESKQRSPGLLASIELNCKLYQTLLGE